MEEHVPDHQQTLATILDAHPNLAWRVAGEVDDRYAGHDAALAIDRLELIHAAQGQLPIKARAFLDWIAPRLRARLLPSDA